MTEDQPKSPAQSSETQPSEQPSETQSHPKITTEQHQQILDLHRARYGTRRIAMRTGVNRKTIDIDEYRLAAKAEAGAIGVRLYIGPDLASGLVREFHTASLRGAEASTAGYQRRASSLTLDTSTER